MIIKIVIPTYNAGENFKKLIDAMVHQQGLVPADVYIIDSSSTDNTAVLAQQAGFNVRTIPTQSFSHGGTRAEAVEAIKAELLVFMTQDALPATHDAIIKLCSLLENNPRIGAAYGRQLPYKDTDVFGTHARLYNYGEQSFVTTLEDRKVRGIKAAFMSDSFGVYRRSVLLEIGNFTKSLHFGEDTVAAAKMLLAGYQTAYCAEAQVYHSHTYSCREEFKRYAATGKFHQQQPWLLAEFGKAEGEGVRFVLSEGRYLLAQNKWYLLPLMCLSTLCKYAGYMFGK